MLPRMTENNAAPAAPNAQPKQKIVAGLLGIGVGGAFVQQFRFAAADNAPPEFKARAISFVLAGGIFKAIIGPQIVIYTREMLAPVMFAGSFVSILGLAAVGAVEKDFVLHGRHIDVSGGKCTYTDGTLAGSDLDMGSAVTNAVAQLRITVDQAAAMAATHPAAFLGLGHERGALAKGLRADWVVLDAALKPIETRIASAERVAA